VYTLVVGGKGKKYRRKTAFLPFWHWREEFHNGIKSTCTTKKKTKQKKIQSTKVLFGGEALWQQAMDEMGGRVPRQSNET